MPSRWSILLLAASLAAPLAAQAHSAVTRAQVREELVRLESIGYRPARNDVHYPDSIQAAEAKLNASQAAAGIGTQPAARGEAGSARAPVTGEPLYAHH
ncbi:DUF4148 domain-containing protein [Burkholderia gladioli]|uniref:DUF4148 domain-containing protein n=1 Tax=Burkholderia gladioli TaxID=28095 RepID=UPI001C25653F|nr:DUF4148 domain-containing protein [Burkholderia gladioli]MBU9381755.1 DUF4148 domain-containing protein [Burkholderia gladioli]